MEKVYYNKSISVVPCAMMISISYSCERKDIEYYTNDYIVRLEQCLFDEDLMRLLDDLDLEEEETIQQIIDFIYKQIGLVALDGYDVFDREEVEKEIINDYDGCIIIRNEFLYKLSNPETLTR